MLRVRVRRKHASKALRDPWCAVRGNGCWPFSGRCADWSANNMAHINTDGQHVPRVAEDPLTPQYGGTCSCEGGRRTSAALAGHSHSDPAANPKWRNLVPWWNAANVETLRHGETACCRHAARGQCGCNEAPGSLVRPHPHPKTPTLVATLNPQP